MPQTFLGLDIGQSTIKAVVLAKKGLTGGQILDARILDIHHCGGIEPALKKLAEDKTFCGLPCCVLLPSQEIMFRQVHLPFRDDNRIRRTLAFELEPLIPLPIEDVVTDYLMTARDGLLVAAMAKKSVQYWIEKVEESLGEISIMDASSSALTAQIADNPKRITCGMMLDIGRLSTHVAFFEDNAMMHSRSLAFGGKCLTEAIAKDLTVTHDEAEKMKTSSHDPRTGTRTVEACRNFCLELQNTIEYMKINGSLKNEPTRIILTGGGSLFNPLRKELETFFHASCEVLDLTRNKLWDIEENIRNRFSPPIMNTAMAAAMRFSTGRKSFNFRQGDFAAKDNSLDLKKQLKWSAVVAGTILALAVVNQLLDYGLKVKQLNGIKKQTAFTFKKNFPEAGNINESLQLQHMKTKLAENKKTFGFYEGLPETTTVELLNNISSLIPSSMDVVLTALSYENRVISMKGEAKTMDDVTSVKNSLSGSKFFMAVTLGSTSLSKDGNKVDFNLRIDVK